MSLFLQFIVALFSHSGESIYDDPFLFRLALNLIYQNGMIPTLKKLTRVTKKTATAIDHIITNSFVENTFKTAIIKTDVSDHFPICIFFPSTNLFTKNDVIYQYKRTINDEKIEAFLQNLCQYDWDTIKTHQDANEAYNNFILYNL